MLFGLVASLFAVFWIQIQSRPIKVRARILLLANRLTDFKMLFTPTRFFHLVVGLLPPLCNIPQFIAQIWSICPFSSTSLPDPVFLLIWELEQSSTMHGNAFCMHSDIWKQNGGAEKALNSWKRGIMGIYSFR